jgi:imidazoleglycerol-phosphate dehydratase
MENIVKLTRKTKESEICVAVDFGGVKADYKKRIQTPLPFLNHMLEHIAWRANIDISVGLRLDEFCLNHLICEDLGVTMGKAARRFVLDNRARGVTGYGDGIGIIDEAKAGAAISFEERAYFNFASSVAVPDSTENVNSEDLQTFLEGFAQGAAATAHIDLAKGVNGHHIWEAVYRAFGTALGRALALDEKRAGMTAGVAGAIEYKIEA